MASETASDADQQLKDLCARLKQGVDVKDRKWGLTTYSQCFVGFKAVNFLVESKEAADKEAAVAIGRKLVAAKLIRHVTGEHDFKNEKLWYRFSEDSSAENSSSQTMASELKINKRPKDDESGDEKEDPSAIPATMRAIRCTAHGPPKTCLLLQDVPVPSLNPKKPGQVLIKVLYASINPIDYKLSTGMMGPASLKPPYTPGFDICGRVVAKGAQVNNVQVGDVIFGQSKTADGSFAEYAICNGKDIRRVPSTLSLLEAAAIPLVAQTSFQALQTLKVAKGERVLILGGSTATGMMAIQMAKVLGCAEILCTSSQEALCRGLGADRVINYRQEKWTVALKDAKLDAIYDCVGGPSWDQCRKEGVLKKDGRFATIVGDKEHGNKITAGGMLGMAASMANRKFWGALGNQKYSFVLTDSAKNLDDIAKLVEAGQLKAMVDTDSPFAFDDYLAMFEKSMAHKARGKLVLKVADDDEAVSASVARSSFRVTYYPFTGRGEPLRLAAALGGVAFEDRFIAQAEFKAAKERGEMRWSGVPELTVLDKNGRDAMTLGQSNSCIRFVGSLCGVYPKNPLLRALCDEVMDSAEDLIGVAAGAAFSGDDAKKDEVCTDESKLPYWLAKFEARLEENAKRGNSNGGFVGDSFTVADCKVFSAVVYVGMLPKGMELIGKYERFSAFLKAFGEDERIKAFKAAFDANLAKYKEDSASNNDFKYAGKFIETVKPVEVAEVAESKPSFRVKYYAFTGRGEPLRLAAALGGVAFEDRFIAQADFKAAKERGEMRWSGVPELTILDANGRDALTLGQSNSCIRFVGSLCGVYPKNPLLRALCDEVMDSAEDLIGIAAGAAFSGDDKKKDEVCTDESKLPYWLAKFEARLEENAKRGSKNGGFVGDSFTVADCKVFSAVVYVGMLPKGMALIGKYERFSAFLKTFGEDERIKAFKAAFDANLAKHKDDGANDFRYAGEFIESVPAVETAEAEAKVSEEAPTPSFRVLYYPFTGRGEPLRLAAALGGISFEDRFIAQAEFKAAKERGEMRWSGVPELTVLSKDGEEVIKMGQSNSCIRFVGSLGGVYPKNPLLRALCDEVMDSAEDLIGVAAGAAFSGDDAKKDEVCTDESKLPYWLGKFEARLEENAKRGNSNGGFVGDSFTVADCKVFSAVVYVGMLPKGMELIGKYERFGAFLKAFGEDERIKAFKAAFDANIAKYKEDSASNNDFKYAGKFVASGV